MEKGAFTVFYLWNVPKITVKTPFCKIRFFAFVKVVHFSTFLLYRLFT